MNSKAVSIFELIEGVAKIVDKVLIYHFEANPKPENKKFLRLRLNKIRECGNKEGRGGERLCLVWLIKWKKICILLVGKKERVAKVVRIIRYKIIEFGKQGIVGCEGNCDF